MRFLHLKFRLWNIDEQRWAHPSILKIDNNGFLYYQRDSKHIPMRYTGMNDANGKEVFEHDIVRVDRTDSFTSYNTGIVEYQRGTYGFVPFKTLRNKKGAKEFSLGWVSLFDWNIQEVIGNQYENSDIVRKFLDHE